MFTSSSSRQRIVRQCRKLIKLQTRSFCQANFMNGANAVYVERMYEAWHQDPNSVHASWKAYFETDQFTSPDASISFTPSSIPTRSASTNEARENSWKLMGIKQLIRSYQFAGHYSADLDPLDIGVGIQRKRSQPETLTYQFWGFKEKDLDEPIYVSGVYSPISSMLDVLQDETGCVTLRQVIEHCQKIYCGTVGYDFMHMSQPNRCNFIRHHVEVSPTPITVADKKMILKELAWANLFENFFNLKYQAQKRFGLDGIESLNVGLKAVINESTDLGVDDFVIGMPHRGRLNVLSNVIRKPLPQIFHEFAGHALPDDSVGGSGDVKYHLGASHDRLAGHKNDKLVHLSLVANPSHLETVDPVVLGKTRAKMTYKNDYDGKRTMAILLHGDAAFAGQGIVYETMGFADLTDYHTGGTLHLIANNQIGFTTDPFDARSSPYCTSVARAFSAPIFHVNADDPEAVLKVSRMASAFRQEFSSDVVIDLIGYRKYGHNEGDEPKFTQPLMYSKIDKKENVYKMYANKLINEGVVDRAFVDNLEDEIMVALGDAFEASKTWDIKVSDWLDSKWEGFKSAKELCTVKSTGVAEEDFDAVSRGLQITAFPENFNIHRRVKKILEGRGNECTTGEGISWGTAEALAFGSLLREGCHVRLSGQDCERGTFSHRHAVIHEQKNVTATERPHFLPLQNIEGAQANFHVCNSPLNEYGVLGFDLGYSLESPHALVLWEAQFGDFANGAQTIFDTYLSSGESKWIRMSGLVCLLPHGYEGGGPEHSSARLERFLQMTDDDPTVIPEINQNTQIQVQQTNWQICNISTPANYFHCLRRQIHRNFRKPLIIASPKYLLRYKSCISNKSEFLGDTKFKRMIEESAENISDEKQVKRLLLCTGKIFFALDEKRKELGLKNIAISRLEQIAPFPFDRVTDELKRFPNAEVFWVQEEPMNMGCWTYIEPRTRTCLNQLDDGRSTPGFIGRGPSAAPAVGFPKIHIMQNNQILQDAFEGL